nr:hypothetical protein [Tanacetum cinerariifolium]
MDMTIDQQVALDEALVPHSCRLRIGRSNFRLLSDISSKEYTLQLVYDVLRQTLFFKAFLVTAVVLEIYMPELWATATVHHHSIRNSEAYKEYYAVATGATLPKTKARVLDVPTPKFDEEISWKSSDEGDDGDDDEEGSDKQDNDDDDAQDDDDDQDDENKDNDDQEEGDDDDDQEEGNEDDQDSDEEGKEFIHPRISVHDEEETRDEESFDPIPNTPKNMDDEGNGKENLGFNVGREEGQDEEDDEDELYRDVHINLEGGSVQMADVHTTQEFEDSHVTLTPVNPDVASLPVSAPTLTPSTIATITIVQQAPTPMTTAPSTLLQYLPNFGSLFGFDHRLKTLEDNFSEFVQTNQFARAVSSIPEIVQRYMDQRMNEAVKTMNEQLEAEVLTWSSNSSKTSYVLATDLSEMELKKILIEKIEGNKSIHRSNEQRNLYKALVEAYESDKILDTYGDTVMLKRHRDDDADKDKEPSTGSDRGSKRRREGKEPESAKEPMQTTHEMEEPSHPEFETGADDQPIAEPSQHPKWESACDVYSKRRIIAVTEHKIIEWHNYKHLDWITVHRDDDKLYKFKEECFAFNVSLRMFTRSIIIQRRVEDLQLSVKSYQKKLNLTSPDMYRSDLKCKEAYIAYSNPRGFIYQNKDKQNRLMRINELQKFSDGTLTDVRTALDDRLKGIRMKCLS